MKLVDEGDRVDVFCESKTLTDADRSVHLLTILTEVGLLLRFQISLGKLNLLLSLLNFTSAWVSQRILELGNLTFRESVLAFDASCIHSGPDNLQCVACFFSLRNETHEKLWSDDQLDPEGTCKDEQHQVNGQHSVLCSIIHENYDYQKNQGDQRNGCVTNPKEEFLLADEQSVLFVALSD